jgi:hypothetical protein
MSNALKNPPASPDMCPLNDIFGTMTDISIIKATLINSGLKISVKSLLTYTSANNEPMIPKMTPLIPADTTEASKPLYIYISNGIKFVEIALARQMIA